MNSNTTWKLIAAALALSAAAAQAQTVQKCAARNGQVRYQSEPCKRGERTIEVWSAMPDAAPAPTRAASGRTRRIVSRANARRFASAQPGGNADACADARAYRDAAERRAGLARNYDLLSTLQRRVFDACR